MFLRDVREREKKIPVRPPTEKKSRRGRGPENLRACLSHVTCGRSNRNHAGRNLTTPYGTVRGENCVASRKVAGTKGCIRTNSAAIPVVRVALRKPSLAKAGFADTDSNAHLGLPFGRSSIRSTLRAGGQARGPDGLLRFTLACQDLATRWRCHLRATIEYWGRYGMLAQS